MNKETDVRILEFLANVEGISAPERLARIHEVYEARGIPKYIYSEEEK